MYSVHVHTNQELQQFLILVVSLFSAQTPHNTKMYEFWVMKHHGIYSGGPVQYGMGSGSQQSCMYSMYMYKHVHMHVNVPTDVKYMCFVFNCHDVHHQGLRGCIGDGNGLVPP